MTRFTKTLVKCAALGLFITLIVWAIIGYRHADNIVVLAQYGPITTLSGRQVTVIAQREGKLDQNYVVYTAIVDEQGTRFVTDIFTDSGDKAHLMNNFALWVQWVKEGKYESNLRNCDNC